MIVTEFELKISEKERREEKINYQASENIDFSLSLKNALDKVLESSKQLLPKGRSFIVR